MTRLDYSHPMVTPLDKRPRSGPYSGLNARSAKRILTKAFQESGLPFAEEDALEIVLAAAGLDRTSLILRGTEILKPEVFETISEHMHRRLSGEPVDHILGWRDFYGRLFTISSDVLSPRADTENLIRGALSHLEGISEPYVLDLGTGSGAIGLTVLAERKDARLVATDVSASALEIARINAQALNLQSRVTFRQGSWWDAVPDSERFDIILSNPPYITDAAMEGLEAEVKNYDPDLALRGGADGLNPYRIILEKAAAYLKSSGWLGFEIGSDQGAALRKLLSEGLWTQISIDQDLGGLDRVVWSRKCD